MHARDSNCSTSFAVAKQESTLCAPARYPCRARRNEPDPGTSKKNPLTQENATIQRILSDLNPAQKEAVLHEDGPLLVLAGAGSGKTRVITHRLAYLVAKGCPPDGILAITFTNKAAEEMKSRTEQLCGIQSPWISTFHSFCARLLRRHIHRLEPYDNSFTIYDAEDSRTLIREILEELRVDAELWTPRDAQEEISRIKNSASQETEFRSENIRRRTLRSVYEAYLARLRKRNAVDFDDLLVLTVRLFREAPDILERYRTQFRYVLIDEYQDINALQYEIAHQLTATHRNLCITGDPDQSIYRWRGADVRNILSFQRDYPDARVVTLDRNYRSTRRILDVANELISHNEERLPKTLWTEGPEGEPVRVFRYDDEREEAREIAGLIERFSRQGVPLGDIAVFYRINALSRAVEQELVFRNIPYSIVGGVEFYLRAEVKDILAYLRIVVNPRDEVSLRRILNVPKRGIGESTIEKLAAFASARGLLLSEVVTSPPKEISMPKKARQGLTDFGALYRRLAEVAKGSAADAVEAAIRQTDYESWLQETWSAEAARERAANIWELHAAATEYDKKHPQGDLVGFLELVNLLGDIDRWERRSDRVSLITLHSAKGLEFPVVIIMGVEKGILPIERSDDERHDLEEERRLLYVGITRARTHLYLTHVVSRTRFGRTWRCTPSPFLAELAKGLPGSGTQRSVELDGPTAHSLRTELWQDYSDLDLGSADRTNRRRLSPSARDEYTEPVYEEEFPYPVGSRVYHDEYGEGVVQRVSGIGRRIRITVEFETAGEKQFLLGYVKLRRVR